MKNRNRAVVCIDSVDVAAVQAAAATAGLSASAWIRRAISAALDAPVAEMPRGRPRREMSADGWVAPADGPRDVTPQVLECLLRRSLVVSDNRHPPTTNDPVVTIASVGRYDD